MDEEDGQPGKHVGELGLCPVGDGESLKCFKQRSHMIRSQH